jgi:hypothetical protein
VPQGVRVDVFFDTGPFGHLLHGIDHAFGLHGNVTFSDGDLLLGNR